MSDQPMKRCSKCKQEFQATKEYFANEKRRRDGLRNYCKPCGSVCAKEYRLRNLDKVRARNRAYEALHRDASRARYERTKAENPEVLRARGRVAAKKYQQAHPDRVKASKRKHRESHRVEIREAERQYNQTHPEKRRESEKRHHKRHDGYIKAKRQNYKARKRGLPTRFRETDWLIALAHWANGCAYCAAQDVLLHADHFIPLASQECPGTIPNNMLPSCVSCNCSKQDRDPAEWLAWKLGKDAAERKLTEIQAYFDSLK